MIIFLIIFLSVYTALNYYIFRRGWQAIGNLPVTKVFYTIFFVITVYGYILTRVLDKSLPAFAYNILFTIGSFWFAFILYFILSLLVIDITRFFESRFHFLPKIIYKNYEFTKRVTAALIILLVCIIVFIGYLNKNDVTVRELNINLTKGDGKIKELNIVMASDIHISVIEGDKFVSDIVNKINSLNPDIVLFAGDIIDDKIEILNREKIGESFKKLKTKYGVFSINGNHEYINSIEPSIKYLENLNIELLRDEYEFIDSSFYLLGRDDMSVINVGGKDRKELEDIIKPINSNYPKILLDHVPVRLNQAVNNDIDLQLSGHTHHGQMWPLNYITESVYEVSWGYKKKGKTHIYVSSGASLWGPPVRTGSRSEIVLIKIKFI